MTHSPAHDMRRLLTLCEAQEASEQRPLPPVLYHGTSPSAWRDMKYEQTMRAGDHGDGYISFTTSAAVAERFALWAARRDGDKYGVVLTMNVPKLAADYPLEPFEDAGTHEYEAEWRIPSPDPQTGLISAEIKSIRKYVTDVEKVWA